MYNFSPVTDRVRKMREKYRTTQPEICIARYKLITEFYMQNPDITGILKRAKNFRNICEQIPVRIDDGEIIVGAQSAKFRACALYPENGFDWMMSEAESRVISTRSIDPYILTEEDRAYILETGEFWLKECMSAKASAALPDSYRKHAGSGTTTFVMQGGAPGPVGHFCTGYDTAVRKGFTAIKAEADAHLSEMDENGIFGSLNEKYSFYRAISIVCEGMITLTKRYARLAEELAARESDPVCKKELEMMADSLNWTMDKPARSFHDAVQCIFMYQTCLCLDANMHGISFGRIDQYLGDFLDADLAAGSITMEYAQEIMDLFYLKIAEMNKPWSERATEANPGYTSGQLMTLGGIKKNGDDATNKVTFMMLEAAARLVLHSPPQALRIHKGTPEELWELAVEATKIAGGVPSFENDDVIIPALMDRGLSLESARNYCLIGCVEPSGCGDEWPACGGTGTETYWNLANALQISMHDGFNPMPMPGWRRENDTPNHERVGPATGSLADMKAFDELLAAFKIQVEFFVKWHASCTNMFEYVAREVLPLPVVSATMDGCMEKGMDVMYGGARYNSTGIAGVGIGTVGDSLQMIKHLVFDTKKCTGRELLDALAADWEGFEDLHNYVKNEAKHYGNGFREADEWTAWAAETFANAVNSCTGPRGRYSAGLYPVTSHIGFGRMTAATPDGRKKHEALSDGISPVQQMDKSGPTAVLVSVSGINQRNYPNGTLLNMKFSPSCLSGPEGAGKLSSLIGAYFDMGGMELQINVVGADTMKEAQDSPDEFKNLVVRVAGFSSYFVELHLDAQNDLIRRTELMT